MEICMEKRNKRPSYRKNRIDFFQKINLIAIRFPLKKKKKKKILTIQERSQDPYI